MTKPLTYAPLSRFAGNKQNIPDNFTQQNLYRSLILLQKDEATLRKTRCSILKQNVTIVTKDIFQNSAA